MSVANFRASRERSAPIAVSFEFFPPKTADMEATLWSSIGRLAPLNPRFVSVTYGAGGSTRERTHATIVRLLRETQLVPAAHLTCVGATRAEVDDVGRAYWAAGVRHVVALRGDPPEGAGSRYEPHPGGYAHAVDLVGGLRRIGDFEITVAAFPEKHPESPSFEVDLDVLKRKVDAGATRAITQFFFENDVYFRFLDRVRSRGINIPIVPGLMPVLNFDQARSFAEKCGARSRPRHPKADCRRRRRRAGARAPRPRRLRIPFLHVKPRRSHLRHLPPPRPAPGAGASGRLKVE